MNLNQITVPSLNVAAAVAFYQQLSLNLIVLSLPSYARFECPNGDATFSIHLAERLPAGDGVWLYFECEDLDIRIRQLLDKGLQIDELPNDKPWLWREARLKDPDGNQLILYCAGENRKNPPWRL